MTTRTIATKYETYNPNHTVITFILQHTTKFSLNFTNNHTQLPRSGFCIFSPTMCKYTIQKNKNDKRISKKEKLCIPNRD